jgi:tetratricopeptide (TPR) repeat protein
MRWALLFICVFSLLVAKAVSVGSSLQVQLDSAIADANRGDFISARRTLQTALNRNPRSIDAIQLLGVMNYQLGNMNEAISLLDKALELDKYQNLGIVANYIEILRSSGDLQKARSVGHAALATIDQQRLKDSSIIYYNLGVVEMNLDNSEVALDLFSKALQYDSSLVKAWQFYGEMVTKSNPAEAERVLRLATAHVPNDHTLHFMLGTACQMQNKLNEALESYFVAETLDSGAYAVKANIAATLQSLGRTDEALAYYQRALPHATNDAGLYNNYGALLGIMGRHDEEVHWLTEALNIQPLLGPALINLAGHYQDEGDLAQARELLRRAASPDVINTHAGRTPPVLFRIRDALMLSPVTHSWAQMVDERAHIMNSLTALLANETAVERVNVDTSLDRIHFYVSYHGLNDRHMQDLVARVYQRYLKLEYYSPYVDPAAEFPAWVRGTVSSAATPTASAVGTPRSGTVPRVPVRRARVGFISKFFGVFEPHGMLLDGVMQYLPRDRFEVIALPVARGDGKPLSPTVQAACDSVYTVALNYEHALAMLQELRLDVLVFADTVSEPMNHFLAHARVAPIQVRDLCFCLSCRVNRFLRLAKHRVAVASLNLLVSTRSTSLSAVRLLTATELAVYVAVTTDGLLGQPDHQRIAPDRLLHFGGRHGAPLPHEDAGGR